MVESKAGQRLAGLFLLTLGAAGTVWTWHSALAGDGYYIKVAILCPAIVVLGIALMLFPLDMEGLREEHGIPSPEKPKFEHYPLHWKIMTVVAIAAGCLNWLALTLY